MTRYQRITAKPPRLNIKVMEGAQTGSWEALVDQRADLVIGLTGDTSAGGYWQLTNLGSLKTHLYCAPSHPASALINIESADQIIDSRALSQFVQLLLVIVHANYRREISV